MSEMLVQIIAPNRQGRQGFAAGLVLQDRKVVRAAPILKHMIGWGFLGVLGYCRGRKWQVTIVEENDHGLDR